MNIISRKVWLRVANNLINHPEFKDVYNVVRKNSRTEKLYLAGGKLYRSLIEELYGYPARAECCDYDFVTVQTVDNPVQDEKWTAAISRQYSDKKIKVQSPSIKLRYKGIKIDLISLGSLPHIIENDLPKTIESYFEAVPLNMQALALELSPTGPQLIGDVGQWSIIERGVSVNNDSTIEKYCKLKGWKVQRYVENKAKSVRFSHKNKV